MVNACAVRRQALYVSTVAYLITENTQLAVSHRLIVVCLYNDV